MANASTKLRRRGMARVTSWRVGAYSKHGQAGGVGVEIVGGSVNNGSVAATSKGEE